MIKPKVGLKFSVLLYQNLIPCFLTFCCSERLIPTHFLNFKFILVNNFDKLAYACERLRSCRDITKWLCVYSRKSFKFIISVVCVPPHWLPIYQVVVCCYIYSRKTMVYSVYSSFTIYGLATYSIWSRRGRYGCYILDIFIDNKTVTYKTVFFLETNTKCKQVYIMLVLVRQKSVLYICILC